MSKRTKTAFDARFESLLILVFEVFGDFLRVWKGASDKIPTWLVAGAESNCRIETFGKSPARVKTETGFSEVGGDGGEKLFGSTLSELRAELFEALKTRDLSLEQVFNDERDEDDQIFAKYDTVFFDYLSRVHRKAFLSYLSDPEEVLSTTARFEKHFKSKLKDFQKTFEKWLQENAKK